jgi:hypothetical protein
VIYTTEVKVVSKWVIVHKDPTGVYVDVYYEGDYHNGTSKWGWFTDYAIHFDDYENALGFSKTITDVECEPIEIKYQLHK